MSDEINSIILEKETVSDDFYTIIDLFYKDGDKIQKGDTIITFEASKSCIDIESPSAGYIYYNVEEGQNIKPGEICAAVSIFHKIPDDYFDRFGNEEIDLLETKVTTSKHNDIRISNAAKILLKEHNLDISIFKGKTILRTEDIIAYLKLKISDVKRNGIENIEYRNKIIIIGGGGHAKMCIDIIRQMKTHCLVGIIDSGLEIGTTTLDVPIIGGDRELEKLFKEGIKFAVIGFGAIHEPVIRQEIYRKLNHPRL